MSKAKTKDLAVLTQNEINAEGIKTQLTQNDLLEVIVSEMHQKFTDRLLFYSDRSKELEDKMKSCIKNQRITAIKEFLKKNKIEVKDEAIEHSSISRMFSTLSTKSKASLSNERSLRVHYPGVTREKSKEKVLLYDSYCGSNFFPEVSTKKALYDFVGCEIITDGVKTEDLKERRVLEIRNVIVNRHTSEYANIMEEIEKHNKEVVDFCKEYEGVDVRYESLLKDIRVKFNKKVIGDSSETLKNKISDIFGISL